MGLSFGEHIIPKHRPPGPVARSLSTKAQLMADLLEELPGLLEAPDVHRSASGSNWMLKIRIGPHNGWPLLGFPVSNNQKVGSPSNTLPHNVAHSPLSLRGPSQVSIAYHARREARKYDN